MSYGVKLHVWGDYACFTRPEMKVERVSYDAMTPSAARGILEAIHWKPAIRWNVDRIHVLKPIRFENVRRNELGHKISAANVRRAVNRGDARTLATLVEDDRQQRATTLLRHVGYVIEAHFVLTDVAAPDDTEAKHLSMFNRRASSANWRSGSAKSPATVRRRVAGTRATPLRAGVARPDRCRRAASES